MHWPVELQLFQVLTWGPSWVAQLVKNLFANVGDTREHQFNPWFGKIPWKRKWQLAPVCLPGKFHGQRSLVGYSPWGCKESDTSEHTNVDISHTISKCHILLTLPVSLEKSLEDSITWWRKQVFQNPNLYFCSKTWILSLAAYTISYFPWGDSLTFLSEQSSCQTMPKS